MSRHLLRFVLVAPLWLLGVAVACGCSDESGAGTAGGGSATGGAGGGSGGSGAATSSGQGGDAGFNPIGTGGSAGGETCLTTEAEATQSPLDIVVLLDRSASMQGSLWDGTVSALTQFFGDPGGDDISVAMSYFPPPGQTGLCQPSSYNPPHVPMTDLTNNASVLITDLQSQTPAGDYTPTHGALYGALQFANTHQDANADHVTILVLASDGDPTACDTDLNNIAALASTALAYNGVKTFVIAIQGATVANLDQIAAAGGTGQALDVTTDINLFKQKMDEIRAQMLACEFIIPEPGEGEEFEPTKVNVEYTPGGSSSSEQLPQANDEADCAGGPGWYYDNPTAPTKITLCPASCALVQADSGAKITFVFGCPTVVN